MLTSSPLQTSLTSARWVSSVATCILAMAMATAVLAGQPEIAAPKCWWRNPAIQWGLRLTSEQVQQLDSIFERDLPARITLHQQIEQLDRQLLRVIELEPDAAVVARLIEKVERLRAQRNVRRILMLLEMPSCS